MKNIMITYLKLGNSHSGGSGPCSGKVASFLKCELLEKKIFSSSALSMG